MRYEYQQRLQCKELHLTVENLAKSFKTSERTIFRYFAGKAGDNLTKEALRQLIDQKIDTKKKAFRQRLNH